MRFAFCAFGLLLCAAGSAMAQVQDAPWPVYVQEDPTRCWITSDPSGTVATRDGQDVSDAINRDEALIFVSFWPDDGRVGEISYTGGYQFANGSTVALAIGDAVFDLFTEGPMSWAGSPEVDAQIIAAMRDGAEMVVTATSTRGTEVVDTFNLQGFALAMNDAELRCAN
ncbi:invasion associated locus B family protein [Hasllibacter sp. MH4015]|uniref:invasion associated locus B family protein n=1 Tax=Hasllibacter sp. MH4015 TaxID=2854029 RepID=UPI001CD71AF5|nr:invasion associated locus B family protein [Hasllibacter sp. MH4015]